MVESNGAGFVIFEDLYGDRRCTSLECVVGLGLMSVHIQLFFSQPQRMQVEVSRLRWPTSSQVLKESVEVDAAEPAGPKWKIVVIRKCQENSISGITDTTRV